MRKFIKPAAFFLLLLLVWGMDRLFGWSEFFISDRLAQMQSMVSDHLFLTGVLYVLITIAGCVLLALPGVTFAVLAGMLFGPWLGTVLCLLATTIGALAAFLAARYFLRDWLKPLVMRNALLKRFLFDDAERSAVVLLLITRLVPLFPYNLQNFAYGITDIRLLPYTLYTFLFMAPGVALFTVGTVGLTAEEGRIGYLALAIVLLITVFALGKWVKSRYFDREEN